MLDLDAGVNPQTTLTPLLAGRQASWSTSGIPVKPGPEHPHSMIPKVWSVALRCAIAAACNRSERAELTRTWTKNGWRDREALQMPVYTDEAKLRSVTAKLAS